MQRSPQFQLLASLLAIVVFGTPTLSQAQKTTPPPQNQAQKTSKQTSLKAPASRPSQARKAPTSRPAPQQIARGNPLGSQRFAPNPPQLIARSQKHPILPEQIPYPKAPKASKKPTPGKNKRKLTKWLQLGPMPAPLPAFHKDKRNGTKIASLLTFPHIPTQTIRPALGQTQQWFPAKTFSWKSFAGKLPTTKQPQVAYFATYVSTRRYVELQFQGKSFQRLQLFFNGRSIGKKTRCTKPPKANKSAAKPTKKDTQKKETKTSNTPKKTNSKTKPKVSQKTSSSHLPPTTPQVPLKTNGTSTNAFIQQLTQLLQRQSRIIMEQAKTIRAQAKTGSAPPKKPRTATKPKPGTLRATLKLTPGTHLLLVKALFDPSCVPTWDLQTSLHASKKSKVPTSLTSSRQPRERYSTHFLLNRNQLGGSSLSPDGKTFVVWYRKTNAQGKREWWAELRQTKDGEILHSFRPYAPWQNLQWSPNNRYYSFITRHGKMSTLWLVDLRTGKTKALRRGLQRFTYHTWAPNSRFIIYMARDKRKPKPAVKTGLKRLRGMNDRWPWYRSRSFLYAMTLDGNQTRLTSGHWTTSGLSIRPDGKALLFVVSQPDYTARPFRRATIFEMNLTTLKITPLLRRLRWLYDASYSPDGKHLLLRGGPSLFGRAGHSDALTPTAKPNEYDTQAYLYDLENKEVKAITKNFAPTIQSAHWHPLDQHIYFTVLDRTRTRLVRYNVKTARFSTLPTGVDMTSGVQFARHNSTIIYTGSGIKHPRYLYSLDLQNPQPKRLINPSKAWFKRIQMGRVKSWSFANAKGQPIEGRIYFPPSFDPRKKYPLLVYYYGGTFPTTRGFDGRYPAHLWASHDYVVYILQPSGAVGYGQAFATKHVNEWGTRVANEIIEGTQKLLQTHTFLDPKRVGCLGASYGGFSTMYLLTRTNMFAAAISHAGISNIASYWGSGYWGFLYNAISAAGRYPWSHPSYYVNQSPLYSAHKINTPLLLLHGTGDTNVPPHESYQMYAALRLLKKPVEMIEITQTNHWVIQYKKRLLWTQTILAWFDRNLKQQPLWWNTLHGKHKH